MEKIGDMELYSFDEIKDELIGKKGTPERDAFEGRVEDALYNYRIGETIKSVRLSQKLTQEDLGERVGVQKAQISRIENGRNTNISTIRRVCSALGIPVSIDFGAYGKVAL